MNVVFIAYKYRLDGRDKGFDVGATIECAYPGVAIVTTNPLHQKTPLAPGRAYLEIRANGRSATRALLRLSKDPNSLTRLRRSADEEFVRVFELAPQMEARYRFLERAVQESPTRTGDE